MTIPSHNDINKILKGDYYFPALSRKAIRRSIDCAHTTETIFLNLKENIHDLGYRCGQVIIYLMENSL